MKEADRRVKCCIVNTRELVNGKSVVENLEFADDDSLTGACRPLRWLITQWHTWHSVAAVLPFPEKASVFGGAP